MGFDGAPTIEGLTKLYEAALQSLADRDAEVAALRAVIGGQVRANNQLGVREANRDVLLAQQLTDHNREVQAMGAEVNRLRSMVVALGGDPDRG